MDLLDRTGDAANQAAAANGNHDRLDFGMLLQNLQSERSLPGDDCVVIERVDEGKVLLLATPDGFFTGIVVIRTVENHFRAEGFGGRYLD